MKVNKRVRDVEGSSTLALTAKAKELQAQGADVVNFAAGEPDFDTPERIKQAAIEAIQKGFTKYTPSTGTQELRKAIVEKFKKDNHLDYKPSQIAVSCGAKHSIFNIIQILVDEGDEVLIPSPYWVSYPEMVKIAGGASRFIPTDIRSNFKITPQQLKASCSAKTKLFILNSPSNPTGMVYSKKELEGIAQVCVEKNIFVISDEIYEKLIYDTEDYISIASLGKDINDLTITVNGVSKAYAMTGWRIGYAGGPQEIMDYIKNFQDHSTSNPTSISQAASLCALQERDDTILSMRKEFKTRRDLMMSCMNGIPLVSYVKPQGAFYLFCDFSKVGNSEDLAQQLLNDVKVAVIPGDSFGAKGFLRLSFATSQARIEEGVKRIATWIKQH